MQPPRCHHFVLIACLSAALFGASGCRSAHPQTADTGAGQQGTAQQSILPRSGAATDVSPERKAMIERAIAQQDAGMQHLVARLKSGSPR